MIYSNLFMWVTVMLENKALLALCVYVHFSQAPSAHCRIHGEFSDGELSRSCATKDDKS